MASHFSFSGKLCLRLFVLTVPFVTASCTSAEWGRLAMPTGYKHHQEAIKAPPGDEPVIEHHKRAVMKAYGMEEGKPLFAREAYEAGEPLFPETGGQADMTIVDSAPVMQEDISGYSPAMETESVSSPPPPPVQATIAGWEAAADDLLRVLISELGEPTEQVYISAAPNMKVYPELESAFAKVLLDRGLSSAQDPYAPFVLYYNVKPLPEAGRALITVALQSAGKIAAEGSGVYDIDLVAKPDDPSYYDIPSEVSDSSLADSDHSEETGAESTIEDILMEVSGTEASSDEPVELLSE